MPSTSVAAASGGLAAGRAVASYQELEGSNAQEATRLVRRLAC